MLADRRRFAHDFENDRRVSEGFDFDALEGGGALSSLHGGAPAAGNPDADGILGLLIYLRDSARCRMNLDCLVYHFDQGQLLPLLSTSAIAAKYQVSKETARQAIERIRDAFRDRAGGSAALRVLLYLRSKPHCRLTLDCLILSYGGNRLIPDLSMRSLSRRRGCSVETVSNICDRIRRDLHLPRNQNNKPEASLASYRKFNYRPSSSEVDA